MPTISDDNVLKLGARILELLAEMDRPLVSGEICEILGRDGVTEIESDDLGLALECLVNGGYAVRGQAGTTYTITRYGRETLAGRN